MENLRNTAYHWLRRSESFFKTDMVYLAKGGFWLTVGQGVASASTFLLAIVFANLLLPEIYGTYKYVLSIAGILTVLTLRGMDLAVFQAVARGVEGVFFNAFSAKIRWGLLSALASVFLSIYYYVNGNNTLSLSFLIIAGFLPLVDSLGIYHSLLRGKKLFKLSAIYDSLSQIGSTLILIITALITQNLFVLLLAYFTAWTVTRFIFFIITVKKHPPNSNFDPETISYGKRTSFINIIDALISSVDGILVFHYLGAVNLAIYSFAIAPVSQLKSLSGHLPTLAMPKLASRSSIEVSPLLKKRFILLFCIGVVISLSYIIAAPYIFQIFFPRYIDAVLFSQIFSLTIVLALPQTIFGAAISSKLTLIPPKMLYLWNLPGIVFLTFALIFVIKFGIIGVIIGRFLSLITGFIVNLIVWNKIRKVEILNPL